MMAVDAPGAIVGVWAPYGAYVRAFGVADTVTGAPTRSEFYSRIGSETQTFTVTAVRQLARISAKSGSTTRSLITSEAAATTKVPTPDHVYLFSSEGPGADDQAALTEK
jgi:hypothetical protein